MPLTLARRATGAASPPTEPTPPRRAEDDVWPGFWKTAGLGAAVLAAWVVLQGIATLPFAAGGALAETLQRDGVYLAVATMVSAVGGTLLVFLLARRPRLRHLALQRFVPKEVFLWTLGALLLTVATSFLGVLLGRPATPQWWLDANAVAPLLLLAAAVFAAPIFEEVLWRGLLFAGWSRTRLKATGTILLTAVLWTAMHVQYDAFDLGQVFVLGILFGYARHRTGSLLVPIAMHTANNLAAWLQAAWLLQA